MLLILANNDLPFATTEPPLVAMIRFAKFAFLFDCAFIVTCGQAGVNSRILTGIIPSDILVARIILVYDRLPPGRRGKCLAHSVRS